MKAIEQYFYVILLTVILRMKLQYVTISMKAIEHFFHAHIVLYKVVCQLTLMLPLLLSVGAVVNDLS